MSFMDKFKNFMGMDEEYYDDEYYEEDYVEDSSTGDSSFFKPKKANRDNVVSIHSRASMKICIHEPISYEESPKIVDDLKDNKAVVLNFEQLDMNIKRQIFDFVSGGLYAVEGKMQKVNKDIFILAPSNVEIDGLREELRTQGIFPW